MNTRPPKYSPTPTLWLITRPPKCLSTPVLWLITDPPNVPWPRDVVQSPPLNHTHRHRSALLRTIFTTQYNVHWSMWTVHYPLCSAVQCELCTVIYIHTIGSTESKLKQRFIFFICIFLHLNHQWQGLCTDICVCICVCICNIICVTFFHPSSKNWPVPVLLLCHAQGTPRLTHYLQAKTLSKGWRTISWSPTRWII